MAESIAPQSCFKPCMWRICANKRSYEMRNVYLKTSQRKFSRGSCKVVWLSTFKGYKLTSLGVSLSLRSPFLRETSLRCFGGLVNGAASSDWLPIGDQLLLITSIFLTYMAGVIPAQKSKLTPQKLFTQDHLVPESSTSSGSAEKNEDQGSSYAWDSVKAKLLDSIAFIEHRNNMGKTMVDIELHSEKLKQPLSLCALSNGPKLRLLWAYFQLLEEEVNHFLGDSKNINMDDWLIVFPEIIRKSCLPVCTSWLEKELCLENNNLDKALPSLMIEKLKGDDTVLQNIRKSGKEVLYAELLYFLRFGSLRNTCCYDRSLFITHAGSILEDLVITLADGIANIYLEFISVDGTSSNEMNDIVLTMCKLSTRALQKLRNEVALNRWLYENLESVISMFEDRFDLCTLQLQLIEEPSLSQPENYSWWKKFTLGTSKTISSPFKYAVIAHLFMPVKRTKELRALTGWRYYLSLYLELADISLPLIKAVIGKISDAISFFLVCLIGRSLGLIYTGIRQSLRWK
ncbi:hypothetical protein HS088_TW22G00276 [Tripterygium wilfordii]|uniref:Phosphoglycolate phosphatase n=1 Tax=Tripterygium wilfordii TaxID=458696 RepID=A0A7J7BYG4_TRIWF|nr:uncharacterized protein LOC119990435 [Tripterygium wilfordii]XP_038692272.1 uncharacterized protein LOC119990435 [Tripterygium wilfordii]XP_038692273.1 uncharacterized protein LOC119990435 [Tripterygium wilfordii]KAF5726596.1 hypothetical protein HS088_TW22G00276 [Tripterygium wilfordii]